MYSESGEAMANCTGCMISIPWKGPRFCSTCRITQSMKEHSTVSNSIVDASHKAIVPLQSLHSDSRFDAAHTVSTLMLSKQIGELAKALQVANELRAAEEKRIKHEQWVAQQEKKRQEEAAREKAKWDALTPEQQAQIIQQRRIEEEAAQAQARERIKAEKEKQERQRVEAEQQRKRELAQAQMRQDIVRTQQLLQQQDESETKRNLMIWAVFLVVLVSGIYSFFK